jgi:peptide-methionine (R)-S-oxide reductase
MSKSAIADRTDKIVKSDAKWRARLAAGQYQVLRQHGTEPAGTSPRNRETREGMFACAGRSEALFAADAKFESGTGWPRFDKPASEGAVSEHKGRALFRALFMRRPEVQWARCDGHLGHVFADGPKDTTGLRYCINGAALKFRPGDS